MLVLDSKTVIVDVAQTWTIKTLENWHFTVILLKLTNSKQRISLYYIRHKETNMNISWVLADLAVLDPTQDLEPLKQIGAFWGSWRTWRAWQTDNVICHDQARADDLVKRDFQSSCNFYIPNSVYVLLNRPRGVQVYEGDFVHDVVGQEEIVALHLATTASDIVLLVGFDFAKKPKNSDRLQEHQAQHYRGLVAQVIQDNPGVQWVVIDHPEELHPALSDLSTLTQDTMVNVLRLMGT